MELLEILFGMKIPSLGQTTVFHSCSVSSSYHFWVLLFLLNTEPSHNLFPIVRRFCETQLSSCDCGLPQKQQFVIELTKLRMCVSKISTQSPKATNFWKTRNDKLENT